jgi:hypothetical protein
MPVVAADLNFYLKPHCIQSTLRRHGIQAINRVMAYVADAVTL